MRNDFVVVKEHGSSFKFRPQSEKHLRTESSLIKLQSEIWEQKKNATTCLEVKRTYSWFLSWEFDGGLSCQGDGNEHRR